MTEERSYVPWIVGAVVVIAAVAITVAVWPDDEVTSESASDAGSAQPSSAWGGATGSAGGPAGGGDPGLGLAWTASSDARSEARERVAVQARPGASAPTLTSEAVVPVLQEVREHVERCVREKADQDTEAPAGASPRPTLGGADGGTGEPAMASFNIGATGRVIVRSFSLDAPASDEVRTCYADAFGAVEFPPPGEGGAFLRIRLD